MNPLRTANLGHGIVRRLLLSTIVVPTLLFVNLSSAEAKATSKHTPPALKDQILMAQDEHTEAALNRANEHQAGKITVTAPNAAQTPEPHVEAGPAISSPPIATEPAPGAAELMKVTGEAKPDAHGSANAATQASATATSAHGGGHSAHAAGSGVSGEQAFKWLINGNKRYTNKNFRADGKLPADRKRVYTGQKPHAIVLSCADSRVPPELVFDQGLGEIFVIRVAGQALDSSVLASAEYAVEHLGPRLLVVLGHTKCGAVDTAMKVKAGDTAGSESLDRLLADIRPRLKTVATEKPSKDLEVESALNADGIARDLVKRSEIVRRKVEAGELLIKTGLYRLDSGVVNFY